MSRNELSEELISAVNKYRVKNHTSFEKGLEEAMRILDNHRVRKGFRLRTKSEYLEGIEKRHSKRGSARKWWPCVSWRKSRV